MQFDSTLFSILATLTKHKMDYRNYKAESLRMKGFDYSSDGAYFITICSFERKNIFGQIKGSQFFESELGKIIKEELLKTDITRNNMFLGTWVIMPNHLHAIIYISNSTNISSYEVAKYTLILDKFNTFTTQSNNLSSFVRGIKASVTSKAKNIGIKSVWQSNFYERIIRNQNELISIENYINENIIKWESDPNYIKMNPLKT